MRAKVLRSVLECGERDRIVCGGVGRGKGGCGERC